MALLYFSENNEPFYDNVLSPIMRKNLFKKTHLKKVNRSISSILMVTCELSGEGASEFVLPVPVDKKRLCLKEAKKREFEKSENWVEEKLKENFNGYSIPQDLGGVVSWSKKEYFEDKPEGSSEKRLLGIIYADINGLGNLVEKIAKTEQNYRDRTVHYIQYFFGIRQGYD
ncbi:hypothetical protein HZA55_08955 [Candidatus Poribacteria bacterium]|nr:hypothetical protein [Candidatus Poribacteria bacterium]